MPNFHSKSDNNIWAICILEHSSLLLGYAAMLAGSQESGADLVQDALVAVIRSHATPESPKAYLLQTIRRRAAEIGRRRHREPTNQALPITGDEALSRNTNSCANEELWSEVNKLSEAQRDVIVLHTRGELPFREIAEVMELPLGTVTSHYSRGLAQLRKSMRAVPDE